MYVCICNGVTDHDIRQAAVAGCRSVSELTMRTGCGASCGTCLSSAAETLDQIHRADKAVATPTLLPLLSQAA
ncbi:bacterioferritin-associated ferredoxin [Luteimonas cucumeris]|uniref:Bacterioferritin-associated ferredoxin n=1 Tax=Luteimonas cucumeris TaxID=985012 RepID=A0A562LEN5_9GAMM|nr:(2Fe-2S)-binding protein [Luteimonas cucumeris]TWI06064.1 bacterioferritin-associated ferredoxin [Luteimonas cucumeris]